MTDTLTALTHGLPTLRERPLDPPGTLRAGDTIRRMTFPDGYRGWLVTGYRQGRQILSDPRFSSHASHKHLAFPSNRPSDLEADVPGLFEHLDPPDHTRFRKRLAGQFTLRRMRLLATRIEEITAQYADAMLRTGPPADLVTDYAVPVSSQVICELLGVPTAERDRFVGHSENLLRLDIEPQQAQASLTDLLDLTGELLLRKKSAPADDVLSVLVSGDDITIEESVGATLLLLVAGHETTANMLSLGTYALLNNPDQMALLRADETLIDSAVEELLRFLTIVHVGVQRTPTEDVEIDGVTLGKGETVLIHLPTANRDPAQFPDPDRLDITRGGHGHLTFSHGIHQCLGQQLARLELRIGYTALLHRFPDLRIAGNPQEIAMRSDMTVYGVHRLPVTW